MKICKEIISYSGFFLVAHLPQLFTFSAREKESWQTKCRRDLSGQATSKSRGKSDQPGEGSAETNVIISAQEDGQIDVNESEERVAGSTDDGMADEIENFYEEDDGNDEEEMQGEPLYVIQELD